MAFKRVIIRRVGPLSWLLGAMEKHSSTSMLKTDLTVIALLIVFAIAAFIFRDALGFIIFVVLGLAILVQLFRMAFMRGRKETLKKLWGFFKDAFWGMG